MISPDQPQRSIRIKSRLLPGIVIVLIGLRFLLPFNGWVILLAGFGALLLLSFFWARSLQKGLQIEREMRFGWKQVGDRLRERILLRNEGWAPSLWVEVDDHSDMSEYDISSVSDVSGYRHRSWYTQGFCDTRGLYTLGPVTLRAQDPFGIFEATVDYTSSANMMVAPPVIALPEIEIASGGRIGQGRSSNKGVEQTISTVGVREYLPSDSLRFLHWPTVARQGDLYVHVFDNEPSSDWWVLLDMDSQTQVGEGARSTVEHGVILAASLVNRGIQQGKHVGLVSYGDNLIWHPPEIGNSHLWAVLRSLATIHPGELSLDQLLLRLRSSIDRNSSLVIITANLSTKWINALELLKRSGIVPTVLVLDPVSFGGSGDLELFHSRLRKLGITYYTISADLLEQPKKRPQGLRWLVEQTRLRGAYTDTWMSPWQKVGRLLRIWGLVFIFFYLMGTLLGAAVRGLEADYIFYLMGGGIVVGWLLVRLPLSGWLAAALSLLIGSGLTLLWVGRLGTPLLRVLNSIVDVIGQLFAKVYLEGAPVDFSQLQLVAVEIWTSLGALVGRLWQWNQALLRGTPLYDPVATTVLWGISIWGVVIWAIWYTFRRKQPLPAFIPSLFLVTVALALGGRDSQKLAFMFGSTIALMAFVNYDAHEQHWLQKQLTFTETIRTRILSVAGFLTVGLVAFSLLAPSISFDFMTEFVQKMIGAESSNPEFVRSLGIQNQAKSQETDILDLRREGGLPNQHLIGSGPELSEQVVMVVQVDASQSGIPENQLAEALYPLYLRSLVYDRYVGSGWASRDTQIVDYAPGYMIPFTEENGRPIRQQVQYVEDLGGLMYTLGIPLSADQDFRVAWRIQSEQLGIYDIFGATVDGETYRADSLVQIHSIDELRAAGQTYPDWIVNRYMGLPQALPKNVLTLARDLTATQTNPYDRAVAIENYLRQFPYNLNIYSPPTDTDIVEYFLFDLQEGYCDYFASAMVVLARAAGMPARYVIGYIGEHYDESLNAYVITADQAHAWAEVYFPEYGWIQFEPTSGRPAIERPPEALPKLPEDFELNFTPLVQQERFSFDNGGPIFWMVLLLIMILTPTVWYISDLRLARMPVANQLPRLYRRLFRYGRWMRLPVHPGLTPYEFAYFLSQHLEQLVSGSYWIDWMLYGKYLISQITTAYVEIMFSPHRRSTIARLKIMNDYKKLRLRLWVLWIMGRIYKFRILRPIFWIEAPGSISSFVEEEQ